MTFLEFARSYEVEIIDLRCDGKIHRCPTTGHPGKRNGAFFFDGQHGWVMNWETGENLIWWNDPEAKPFTETEKREWMSRRRAAEVEKQQKYAQAAHQAAEILSGATMATHPYLAGKGFKDHKALVDDGDGALLIPMRDCMSNDLLGLQRIRLFCNEWEKKFLYGARTKGAIFRIGAQNATETILAEGFATSLSIAAAVRLLHIPTAVVACFSANNIIHVAGRMKGKRFVFADHDANMVGEKAAQATGLPYCMSDKTGNDANDDHMQFGLLSVASKIMQMRRFEKS